MTTTTFQYTYVIHARPAEIYQHLSNPMNYIGLSPLVISVSDIQWGTNTQDQRYVHYHSIELFRFLGLIPYRNPIDVVMTLSNPDQQIISDVRAPLTVSVRFVFDLLQQPTGTAVTETITATTPFFLSGFTVSQAKGVQQNRARVLKQRMENGNQKGG